MESGLGLTNSENLYFRIAHARLIEIVSLPEVQVCSVGRSENDYGEFLFITLIHTKGKSGLTLFGCGFHELRERWFIDEWHFYAISERHVEKEMEVKRHLSKDAAITRILLERQRAERRRAEDETVNKRSQIAIDFELLADLTDDDGATSMLQDLGYPL